MLKLAGLKYSYSSENCSIVKDFYIPALKNAKYYDRAVGFFSSSSLSIAARGLAPLLKSGGVMRLIIGYPVSTEDFEAIKKGITTPKQFIDIENKISNYLDNLEDSLECRRFDALSFLVASNRLQIRFAFRPRGMYHEKIGIIRDSYCDRVAFIGSANETENALNDNVNSESINSYFSWDESVYKNYGIDIEERFEKLWSNEQPVTKTFPASLKFLEKLEKYHTGKDILKIISSLNDEEESFVSDTKKPFTDLPVLPSFIGQFNYSLRSHQRNALQKWVDNKYRGIFKLATGAGKTITALHACTILASNDYFSRGLCAVVAVPYQGLAEQWRDEMRSFNINPLICYKSQSFWLQDIKNRVSEFNLSTKKTFIAIIVVNDTLKKETFLAEINKIKSEKLFFIGDECHNHANNKIINLLPNAGLRLGLSATPWNASEIIKKELLTGFYGDVVAEYGLMEAINDGVLCPYEYIPVLCEMSEAESDWYEELSVKITKMEAIKESGVHINDDALMHIYLKRSRLLGSLKSKLEKLDALLLKNGKSTHTLFYCGEGGGDNNIEDEKTIDEVTEILHRHGWRTSKFTSDQTLSMRKKIMATFKNADIDALVSKRVLDEGIDVPACTQAFIMASTRNERQYIQRRGRVLRRAPNKDKAIIYDFVVKPPPERNTLNCFVLLMQQERYRVEEFSSLSINKPVLGAEYEN
ncbi:hypothetical protein WB66_01620 [bacteria symbiont BFo1 of Frankliniella occidentalis]|nr:hypothetical protein WB66_01620 [bacteria symbiont BFo1 of Frankliniella occidentalis]